MRRKILIGALALGTVLGFGGGIASMAHRHHHGYGHGYRGCDRHGCDSRYEHIKRDFAQACVDAARRGQSQPPGQQQGTPYGM